MKYIKHKNLIKTKNLNKIIKVVKVNKLNK